MREREWGRSIIQPERYRFGLQLGAKKPSKRNSINPVSLHDEAISVSTYISLLPKWLSYLAPWEHKQHIATFNKLRIFFALGQVRWSFPWAAMITSPTTTTTSATVPTGLGFLLHLTWTPLIPHIITLCLTLLPLLLHYPPPLTSTPSQTLILLQTVITSILMVITLLQCLLIQTGLSA